MTSLQQAISSVSKYLYSQDLDTPLLMYGSDKRLLLGCGIRKEFYIKGDQHDTSIVEELDRFLEDNCKFFVFGYISFNYHYSANKDSQTLLKFVVPSLVIEIASERARKVDGEDPKGIVQLLNEGLYNNYDQHNKRLYFVDSTSYDSAPIKQFTNKIQTVKNFISSGDISRLTLARKIQLPSSISLIDSFLFRKSLGIENERSYFWKDETIQFVGSNPELLAVGNRHYFETFKLSGTTICSTESKNDDYIKKLFINDKKIKDEHESSVKGMAESLNKIGSVVQQPRSMIDWYNLRHMMTKFSTTPLLKTSIASILTTILPTGCDPKIKGLKIIQSLESESRGPYYGIIGVVEPNGNFAFSQNIRTVFRAKNQTYLWVGAAITQASNVMSEYEETQTKAKNTICSAPFVFNMEKEVVCL